ncbi:MAG: DUF86 domain-containing protein [Candidatus Omnitrophota bacterium]
MVKRDIVIAKIANINDSLSRLKEKQGISLGNFLNNRDVQDIVRINLLDAIQGCIDIASHIISDNDWGIPGSFSGLFDVLYEKKVISREMLEIMCSMAGFRNVIVHEYAKIDMNKVFNIFTNQLSDIEKYLEEIVLYCKL